jgi:hypothetical protein
MAGDVLSFMDMIDSSWVKDMDRTQARSPEASFASLPESGDELGEIGLQHLVAHAKAASGVKALFFEIETVVAVQIAGRTCRLGQNMNAFRQVGVGHRVSKVGPASAV